MDFKSILEQLPSIEGIQSLAISQQGKVIHEIPAIPGKLGSLRVYHALAVKFDGVLNSQSAEQGLQWFAEHTEDAKLNPGKHPNIDLLLQVIADQQSYQIEVVK